MTINLHEFSKRCFIFVCRTGVSGEGLGDDQKCVGKNLNTELGLTGDGLHVILQMSVGRKLKRTTTGDDVSVIDGVGNLKNTKHLDKTMRK